MKIVISAMHSTGAGRSAMVTAALAASIAFSMALSLLLAAALPAPASSQVDPIGSRAGADERRAGTEGRLAAADASWQRSIAEDMVAAEYDIAAGGLGLEAGRPQLEARNRAQNLRASFTESEIAISPREHAATSAWRLSWRLTRVGRPGTMTATGSAIPTVNGKRVQYRRTDLVEWYENRPEGVEQGFDVLAAPAGEGLLYLEGDFASDLLPAFRAADDAIDFFDGDGACVFSYAGLEVWDATGRTLPAELRFTGTSLLIQVDDRDATYPVTVDPLMTSPAWTQEGNQAVAGFGMSVATAGDVNGDGYSDVIVGAIYYDNGQSDEGRAFLYFGSPTGLATTPSWTAESNQAGARFGCSVATAGDVNGDGYADVIVGASNWDNGQNEEGRAYVYLGSGAGLTPTPAWTAESNLASAYFGSSVATAGDVNGDGYADVIVGAPIYSGQTGFASIYLGSAAGLALSPVWTAGSGQGGSWYGGSVASAGDVNGDGYSDVIVGAEAYDNGQMNEGRAFVYRGSATGLLTSPSWTLESDVASAYFGRSVAGAGDVNGDGFADAVVGASQYENGQSLEGATFLYLGSAGGLATTPAWTVESNQIGAHLGELVAPAGDVNGDGYADVIVGAPEYDNGQTDEGKVFVYLGGPGGLPTIHAWTAEPDQADASYGSSAATAGDVNGDGFADVIVGANRYDNGEQGEGRAFVYHGSGGTTSDQPRLSMSSPQANSFLGGAVAGAGDVNGDGYGDFICGAANYDNGATDEGGAFIYLGEPDDASLQRIVEPNQADAHFGWAAAGAGDVNGDGFTDVIVGAPDYDNGQSNEGRAYVYLGSATGIAATPAWTAESNQAEAHFGWSVASAGDVNGDGYADVIVGAYQFDNGTEDEGRAFVYHGSATGLATTPSWTGESNQQIASFGYSVASAGDVNGDGFSDVIVGAYLYDNGQSNEGRAFVYHGSASGLAATPAWTGESNQAIADFGFSVASAGDVNADGFSDVIIGAEAYDNGEAEEGRAFVYHGSPTGLATAPAWTGESNQSGAQFGFSVSTAGDVNADGFSDVVVGAVFYTNNESLEGGAFVFHGSAAGLATAPAVIVDNNQDSAWFGYAVALLGDVNGDGFSDVLIGAPYYDSRGLPENGWAFAYLGNGPGPNSAGGAYNPGLDRIARQARSDDSAPIALLGRSNYQNAILLKALGRTPAGRGRVWFEYEVKRLGVPFDGQNLGRSVDLDTGAPSQIAGSAVPLSEAVLGLTDNTPYRWRLRLRSDSPFFPGTPWLTMPGNGASETDLRTRGNRIGVEEAGAPEARPLLLEPIRPNPFVAPGEIAYALPAAATVRLAIYDVQGRARAVLADGVAATGRHVVRWDGRATAGGRLEAGIYFVRLAVGDRIETRKLLLAP